MIESPSHKPAAAQLVFRRRVVTKGVLSQRQLLALTPDELAACDKRMVDGAAQWFPAKGGVDSVQVGEKIRALIIVASGIGNPQVKICGFCNVLIAAEVGNGADITPLRGLEHVGRIATEHLTCRFEKDPFWRRQYPLDRDACIVDA